MALSPPSNQPSKQTWSGADLRASPAAQLYTNCIVRYYEKTTHRRPICTAFFCMTTFAFDTCEWLPSSHQWTSVHCHLQRRGSLFFFSLLKDFRTEGGTIRWISGIFYVLISLSYILPRRTGFPLFFFLDIYLGAATGVLLQQSTRYTFGSNTAVRGKVIEPSGTPT